MISFPNAKLNLGLYITGKRADGFHDIESIFLPISLTDALEFTRSDDSSFSSFGLSIPGSSENNLVWKAYELMKRPYNLPKLSWYLYKHIPMGAGIGGGSADGAFAIKMLNDHFELNLSNEELMNLAGKLGSDCMFFIENSISLVKGRGEEVKPVSLSGIDEVEVMVIYPGVHRSTKSAYSKIAFTKPPVRWEAIQSIFDPAVKLLGNAFEPGFLEEYSEGRAIKTYLKEQGAFYTSLSGSGSVIYGLFNKGELKDNEIEKYQKRTGHRAFKANIL